MESLDEWYLIAICATNLIKGLFGMRLEEGIFFFLELTWFKETDLKVFNLYFLIFYLTSYIPQYIVIPLLQL